MLFQIDVYLALYSYSKFFHKHLLLIVFHQVIKSSFNKYLATVSLTVLVVLLSTGLLELVLLVLVLRPRLPVLFVYFLVLSNNHVIMV